MNSKYCLVTLDPGECSGYVVGALLPPSEDAYSPALDIRFNRSLSGWRDSAPHIHMNSEEYYLVLLGQINLRVNDAFIAVSSRQMCGVRAGTSHQMVGGVPPVENFVIRVQGGGRDRVVVGEDELIRAAVPPIWLDLHQSFHDYPLGACLPETHLNYSSRLDFTCVWGVDPTYEWHNERLHYHTMREEYYILLRGQLDFQIGSEVVSLIGSQVLGVKPFTPHKVLGGQGPVDMLFVRVPGGRGDKILVGE